MAWTISSYIVGSRKGAYERKGFTKRKDEEIISKLYKLFLRYLEMLTYI